MESTRVQSWSLLYHTRFFFFQYALFLLPILVFSSSNMHQQVETRINIRTILQKSPEAAKHMVTEARKVLESWHATYMDVRHRIEESGTDHRWEFDRKRLFEQTNYMARVCGDLLEVNVATTTKFESSTYRPDQLTATKNIAGIRRLRFTHCMI